MPGHTARQTHCDLSGHTPASVPDQLKAVLQACSWEQGNFRVKNNLFCVLFHRQCSQCLLPWLQVWGCCSKPKISPRALQCCCRGGWQSPGTAALQHLQCSSGMGEASLPPAAFPVLLESTTKASGLPQEHVELAPACCRQHPPSPACLQHAECSAKGQKGSFWWPASNMGPSWPRLMKIIIIKNPVPSIPCTTRAKSVCELVRLGAFPSAQPVGWS